MSTPCLFTADNGDTRTVTMAAAQLANYVNCVGGQCIQILTLPDEGLDPDLCYRVYVKEIA